MEETDDERWPHWARDFTQARSQAFGRQTPSQNHDVAGQATLGGQSGQSTAPRLGARFAAAVDATRPRVTTTLDIDVLSQRLMASDDPLSDLGLVVADIRSRQRDGEGGGDDRGE